MRWTRNLAYVVGLITSDGSLSKDSRHIDFTSKDKDQIDTFIRLLKLTNKIGEKRISASKSTCYRVQFGHKHLYAFLLKIGLTPNKSKTLGKLNIPDRYFAEFLRGYFDGDGCTYSYFDPRWKNSYMLYTSFVSGSINYLNWLNSKISSMYKFEGRITALKKGGFQLRYARNSSYYLLKKIYNRPDIPCLQRKRSKIDQSLGIIDSLAGVSKLVYEHA